MIALSYLAGLATPFLLYVAWCVAAIAISRTSGTQCMVCSHLNVDIDDRSTRAYIWVRKAWHRVWWRSRRWHRIADAAHRAKWARR